MISDKSYKSVQQIHSDLEGRTFFRVVKMLEWPHKKKIVLRRAGVMFSVPTEEMHAKKDDEEYLLRIKQDVENTFAMLTKQPNDQGA